MRKARAALKLAHDEAPRLKAALRAHYPTDAPPAAIPPTKKPPLTEPSSLSGPLQEILGLDVMSRFADMLVRTVSLLLPAAAAAAPVYYRYCPATTTIQLHYLLLLYYTYTIN